MKNRFALLTLATGLIISQPTLSATVIWEENFDGTAINGDVWDTTNITTGLRWCAYTPYGSAIGPGNWIDIATTSCNGVLQPDGYGTVEVGGGVATFSGVSQAFPFIFKELDNPELDGSNFSIEYRMKYNSVHTHGSGLVIRGMDDPASMAVTAAPFNWTDTYLYTWGDYRGSMTHINGGHYPPINSTDYHIHRLDYVDGSYYYYLDDVLIEGPLQIANRPNMIWIGDAIIPWWSGSGWSSFTMDYVKVTTPDDPLAQCTADLAVANTLADTLQTNLDNATIQLDLIAQQIQLLVDANFHINTNQPIENQIEDLVEAITSVNGRDVQKKIDDELDIINALP